jgi:hypothetical protein
LLAPILSKLDDRPCSYRALHKNLIRYYSAHDGL